MRYLAAADSATVGSRVSLMSNGQMLCTGVGSGGDFLDVFLNSILEHDSLDDLG